MENTDKAKEYQKQYYEKHKETMIPQVKEAQKRRRVRNIIKKLNNNEYKRIPYNVIAKHNIKFDENKKCYFI